MPIINKELWEKFVGINQDAYGKPCVDTAREIMRLLDDEDKYLYKHIDENWVFDLVVEGNKIISRSEQCGLSGFQAGAVAQIIFECHSRGVEFKEAWNRYHQISNEGENIDGVLNPSIIQIGDKLNLEDDEDDEDDETHDS